MVIYNVQTSNVLDYTCVRPHSVVGFRHEDNLNYVKKGGKYLDCESN